MNLFLIILSIAIILILLITLSYIIQYNNINDKIIRIDEAEVRIDNNLRDKYDNLNKLMALIKAKLDTQPNAFNELVKLKSRKISNFDLDRTLVKIANEFFVLYNNETILKEDLEIDKCFKQITLIDEELISLRNYYNNKIVEYNKMVKKFPTVIVALINKYKEKKFYDLKDMKDNDIEDFKL